MENAMPWYPAVQEIAPYIFGLSALALIGIYAFLIGQEVDSICKK